MGEKLYILIYTEKLLYSNVWLFYVMGMLCLSEKQSFFFITSPPWSRLLMQIESPATEDRLHLNTLED